MTTPLPNAFDPATAAAVVRNSVAPDTLEALASKINASFAEIKAADRDIITRALKIGGWLNKAKAREGEYGKWGPWRTKHCPGISKRTDERYRLLADHRDLIEAKLKNEAASHFTLADAERWIREANKPTDADTETAEFDSVTDAVAAETKTPSKRQPQSPTKSAIVAQSEPRQFGGNDPVVAAKTCGENFFSALEKLKNTDADTAKKVAAAIIERLKKAGLI
jgi:hypothetical protein